MDSDMSQLLAHIGDGNGHTTTFEFDTLIRRANKALAAESIGRKGKTLARYVYKSHHPNKIRNVNQSLVVIPKLVYLIAKYQGNPP